MKVSIIYNEYKEEAILLYQKIKEYLEKKGISLEEKAENSDFAVVIGGDGTLLKASKRLHHLDIIAINLGSLGFLTDIRAEESFEMLDKVIKGEYSKEYRNFLEININGQKTYALNDVVITKGGVLARMIRLRVYANKNYVNTYRADGIIISSPTGSTAYSLSAGGPIISPELKAMVITPISPQGLSTRPIVVPGKDFIEFELIDLDRDIYLMVDGQETIKVNQNDKISVSLSSKKLSLVKPENRDYYSILREKLKWGDKLC